MLLYSPLWVKLEKCVSPLSWIYCHAESHYAECHYAECRHAECRYAECRFAECVGVLNEGSQPYFQTTSLKVLSTSKHT